MRSLLLGILALISAVHSADHDTFKDCSRVPFCTELRALPPAQIYTGDINTLSVSVSSLTFTLKANDGTSDLIFQLVGLAADKFRATINEVEDFRYKLKDVLLDEPQVAAMVVTKNPNGSISVQMEGSRQVTIEMDPFRVEFSKNGAKLVVIDADMLRVTKNEQNAPFRVGFQFPAAVQMYGVAEHADKTALRNTNEGGDPYRLKNSDVGYYELNSPMALYGAVPVLYGHGPSATCGVFLHNAAEQWIDIQNNVDGNSAATFLAETGAIDVFILLGPTPQDVVRQYTSLTGTAHMPQVWTLGYHQSRYSYETEDQVKEVLDKFNEFDFQLDAIWLDIDYTDSYKYFTWNYTAFSDPVGMQQYIQAQNRSLVAISDPHIKVEQGYFVYDGALKNDFFVKNADGSVFEGPCWPGTSSYIDFLKPEARAYYGSMYSFANFQGSTPVLAGIWNDMNEPSVFDNSLEMTLPSNALHAGNVTHNNIHNIYGFLQTMATHQGLMERDEGKIRPFILTRSHFAGSQRYAAIWTGDNQADWGYLAISYAECLNSNLMGIVFCGADVGGFFNDPDTELLQRWYQAGAWLPFYRAHSTKESARREPYLFDEEVQSRIRKAIEMRYQHLPMWYTIFYEHVRNGDPVIRPLFYQYPNDMNVLDIDQQLLVGSDIMVKAVSEPGATTASVYFPGGEEQEWYEVEGDETVEPGVGFKDVPITLDFIPVYYRSGSIIVKQLTKYKTAIETMNSYYDFDVFPNANGTAHGTWYMDDYKSFAYLDKDYSYYSIDYANDMLSITPIDGEAKIEFSLSSITVTTKSLNATSTIKKVYTTDANGRALRDIKMGQGPTTLRLK